VYVNSSQIGNRLTVVIGIKNGAECLLHWGLSQRPGGAWQRPSMACWPAHTVEAAGTAVRTPLTLKDKDAREIAIEFDLPAPASHLAFVLFFPRENRWLKSNGGDFMIRLPAGPDDVSSPQEALAAWVSGDDVVRQSFPLEGGTSLAAATRVSADQVRVHLACDADAPLLLHWGLAWQFRHEWQLPPESLRTKDTIVEQQAARTPFHERKELQYLELEFPRPADGAVPRWLKCVLFQPGKGAWLKCQGQEIYLPLFADAGADPSLPTAKLWDLAGQIVAVEKGAPSWTLMHRFNLCHDLLQNAQDDAEALALLYIWLRYSALRQLDWQRKYNTQPRELSHAQDRLTRRLAGIYRQASEDPARRNWIRLMFTTLGRGGEGQRVRDEILQIMHRNHLKETSGTFIEEWHQKLHNNTTPDDVVICAAYLEFLKSNGNVKQFYQSLETGGVTRDRLKGFERAIKTDPVFFADRKDVLIREFENFLRILKSVHAGTDLESSVAAARPFLNAGLKQKLDAILSRQQGSKDRMLTAIAAREELRGVLDRSNDAELRDLLFLDLALEEFVRGVVERQNLGQTGRDAVVDLVHAAMRNLKLSVDSPELAVCTAHWGKLCTRAREGQDWALHAKSVADRTARWVQEFSSAVYQSLQAKAEFMGKAFGAQAWTMNLFSEEVIRGGAAFALSLALRALDPLLRKAAGLGGWQVISPAHAAGRMRVVDRLSTVQSEQFAEDTVLVADAVEGNEEIPARVTAVITRDSPDLLSHVAVRARNAHVLFAIRRAGSVGGGRLHSTVSTVAGDAGAFVGGFPEPVHARDCWGQVEQSQRTAWPASRLDPPAGFARAALRRLREGARRPVQRGSAAGL
jgi:alpha-glucan,water dikinase